MKALLIDLWIPTDQEGEASLAWIRMCSKWLNYTIFCVAKSCVRIIRNYVKLDSGSRMFSVNKQAVGALWNTNVHKTQSSDRLERWSEQVIQVALPTT